MAVQIFYGKDGRWSTCSSGSSPHPSIDIDQHLDSCI